MKEKDKLIKYFEKGYLINGPIKKISEIFDTNLPKYAPFKGKTLIMLIKGDATIEGNDTTKIVTDDKETIKLAKQKRKDQDTPIGTLIYVICEISGTNVTGEGFFDLESFIHALNENSNWEFESYNSLDYGSNLFTIKIKTESLDAQAIDKQIEIAQHFIDLLAFYEDIGILIHDIKKALIPKVGPFLLEGRSEKRLGKPSKELISKIVNNYSCSGKKELYDATHGLNRSYAENYLPNRISMLWATIETLFGTKSEHLLKEEEIKVLIECIEQLDIWKPENDKMRLEKLKERIKDPNVLSSKNRNERIASSISDELNRDYNETLKMIRFVSKIRGKYLHELRKDEQMELRNAEEYLQEVLKAYLKEIMDIT